MIKLEFTFEDDAEAANILRRFCLEKKYLPNRLKVDNPNWIQTEEISETNPQYFYESKLDFFTRFTIKIWTDASIQGEIKEDYARKTAEAQLLKISAKIL